MGSTIRIVFSKKGFLFPLKFGFQPLTLSTMPQQFVVG